MSFKHLYEYDVHLKLLQAADILEDRGLSKWVPVDDDGRVSLPYALCVACSALDRKTLASSNPNNFYELVDSLEGRPGMSLCMAWDAIEWEVGDDLVVWSESVGLGETVRQLRSLARLIDLPKIHVSS